MQLHKSDITPRDSFHRMKLPTPPSHRPLERSFLGTIAHSQIQHHFLALVTVLSLISGSSGVFGQSFLVDFGPWTTSNSSVTTPPATAVIQNGNYWNFLNNSTAYTNPVTTIEGATSAVNITQSGGTFNTGVQFVTGSPNLSNLGVFNIDTVFLDAIFAASNTTGSVNLSSLNSNQTYDFILFGSRVATDNRTTTYTVNGSSSSSGMLQTSGTDLGGAGINYNNSSFYTASGIAPNASSNITVTYVNPTGFSYLSAMGAVGYVSYGDGSSITLSSAKDYPGATVLSNGTTLNANAAGALGNSTIGSPLVFRSSNTTVNLGADQTIGSLSGNGTLNASTHALTIKDNTSSFYLFNNNGTLNNIGNNTFSGNITGSGSINKTGNQTLTLSGSGNTFNGTLTVSSGTLALGNVNAVQNTTLIANSTVTLDAIGTYTIGALGGSADINIGNRTVYMGANNASTVYSGNLTGSAPIYTRGTGALTLSGSNSFTGGLWVGGGTLLVGSNNALGSNVTGTITLDYNVAGARDIAAAGSSSYTISRALDIYRDLNLGQSSVNTGSLTFAGAIKLGADAGNRTITTASNTSHTFSGAVEGTRGIIKEGAGTLTLSGANTYTGATTINAGTLLVNGNSASTAVTANAGVIGGSGSVGDLVVNSGARIAPGAASSIGILSANTLTLAGGSGYTWQIGNVSGTAGTNWDLLNIGGGSGAATISATSGNKFTIYITSTGIPTGWSPGSSGNWDIIDWGTVTGFDSNVFAIDTSGFGGVLSGTWSVSNTGGFLNLAYAGSAVPTWNGGTGNWSTGFTPPPVNADNIFFAGASAATATNDIASASLNSIANITFESSAGAFTLAANSGSAGFDASSPLAVTGFILNSSNADQTINTALSFAQNSTLYATSGNLIFGGPVANSQTLAILDNGGVQFNGAVSNNGTILQSGNGSTSVSGAISGPGALTKNGTGTLILSGANSYSGATTVNAGTLALTGGNAVLDSGAVSLNSGGTLSIGGSESIGSVNGAGNVLLNANLNLGGTNSNSAISGSISGTGELQKAGTGTLTLSGSNSFTGDLRFDAGTILVGNNNGLGANGVGAVVIRWDGSGQTLAASGSTGYIVARALNIYNDLSLGQSSTNTGSLNFSGAIAIGDEANQTRTITTAAGTSHTLSGAVSGLRGFVKAGSGSLVLSGNNTYSGGTAINAGTLQIGHANGLGTSGNVTFGGGTLQYGSGITSDISSRIKNSGSAVVIDTNSQNITYSSAIDSTNTSGLTKTGAGTLIFTATNSYTGVTTISAGTLQIGNGNSTGSLSSASNISNSGNLLFNITGPNTNFSNIISGTGGVTKGGNNYVTLSGSNSYSGITNLNLSILIVGNNQALGTSAVTFNGGALDLNGFTINNTMSGSGGTIYNQSTTSLGVINSNINGGSGLTLVAGGGGGPGITFNGTVAMSSGGYVTDNYNGQSSASPAIISYNGAADNSNLNMSINGANKTVVFNKASSASVHAMGGTLITNSNSVLVQLAGTGDDQIWDGSTVNINSGGFDLNGRNETIANMRLNGSGPSSEGALRNNNSGTSSTLTVTGNLTMGMLQGGGVGTSPRIGGAGNLTIAGRVTENTTASLTKVGVGTLILTGNNSYTGGTDILSGTISLGHANALGTTGTIALSGGGIQYGSGITTDLSSRFSSNASQTYNIDTNGNSVIFSSNLTSSGGSLTKNGAGSLDLAGTNTYTGATTVNAGVLSLSGGNAIANTSQVVVNAGGTLNLTANETVAGLSGAGNVTLGSSNLVISTGGNATQAFSGVVSGSGNLNFYSGNYPDSATLELSGANTFTGFMNLDGGILKISNIDALQNATLNPYGTANKTVVFGVAGSNTYNIGALAGGIALDLGSNTLSIGSKNAASTFSGSLSGTGGITKVGTATLTLSGSNSYTGNTIVSSGSLTVDGGNAIADTSAVSVSSGAVLNLNTSETVGSIAGGGNITLGANTLTAGGDNSSTTFSGIASGTGGLTKSGSGTLTLSGSNAYTGTTVVNAGTLLVNGSTNSGSAVTVAIGATLGGSGNIGGPATVSGSLSPDNSPGVLTFGQSLTLESTSTTLLELNGRTRGSQYDGINVTGALTYGGNLTITIGTQFLSDTDTFDLFSFGSQGGNLNGVNLAGAYGNGVFTLSGSQWSYTDSSSNIWSFDQVSGDLAFAAVPEPGTYAFLMIASLFGVFLLFRKKKLLSNP